VNRIIPQDVPRTCTPRAFSIIPEHQPRNSATLIIGVPGATVTIKFLTLEASSYIETKCAIAEIKRASFSLAVAKPNAYSLRLGTSV